MMTETDASTRDLLRDTATRLLQDLSEDAALRTAEGGNWPAAMWRAIEDAGLPKALVPEAAGGSGVSFNDAMVIARAAGQFALPLPLPETCLRAGCSRAPACRCRTVLPRWLMGTTSL